jgi:hypothetical protein
MSEPPPMPFFWDAERSVMIPRRKNLADRIYVDGEDYRLGVIEERSMGSHGHFFAMLHEAFMNLPDDLAERFQTPDHLRKYALIKAGFYDERSVCCSSKAEAQRIAAFMRPLDNYAIVIASEAVVRIFTAKSQSLKAMGKDEFQRSKTAVLEIVSSMIATSQQALSDNAGRAA